MLVVPISGRLDHGTPQPAALGRRLLEPIAAWRREAQAAKAVLEIAARLNVEAVPYEGWQRLDMDREQRERMKLEGDRHHQAHVLAG